jgi:hypothetical protein
MSPTSYQTAPPRKTIIAWWLLARQPSPALYRIQSAAPVSTQ